MSLSSFFFCTLLNGFYLFLSNMNNSIYNKSFVSIVKCFGVLLCITNNSINNQSFVYTQLNDQTVLFQTSQFSINHLLVCSLNVQVLCDPLIRPYQVQPLWARVDQGVMAMKGYSPFSKVPALLEPHNQIVSYPIQDTCDGTLTPLQRCSLCIL